MSSIVARDQFYGPFVTIPWVNVKDTGVGIAPEHIEHVFERFWQADQARAYQAGGFGLGLAIAQNIAQNHRARSESLVN